MKYITFWLLILLSLVSAKAQELKVMSFQAVPMDLSASTQMRRDANNDPCALVKVILRAKDASFEGNIVGNTEFRTNEYWVYMTAGSKMLRIKHISAQPLMVRFADYGIDRLETKVTYELVVQLPTGYIQQSSSQPSADVVATRKKAIAAFEDRRYMEAFELFNGISDDAEAQFYLGKLYYNGNGVTKSDSEALNWYAKSANQGFAKAQNNLGIFYQRGIGTSQSLSDAVYWFRKAAEQGLDHAQGNLGNMYFYGQGVEKSESEAAFWYQKAADQNNSAALTALGLMYWRGQGVTKDEQKAFSLIKRAAENGNTYAMCCLGRMCRFGIGTETSYPKAVEWLKKGAEQNDVDCILELGSCYNSSIDGWKGDNEEAERWYKKAIELGCNEGYARLGSTYHYYNAPKEELEKAYFWFMKGAEMNDGASMYKLGVMYKMGQYVKKDTKEAVKWFRKSVEHGEADGYFALGEMYYDGLGVKKDRQEAYRLIKLAEEKGCVFAPRFLMEHTFND